MMTNTTSRGSRAVGTVSVSYDKATSAIQAHRMVGGASSVRDRVMLQGHCVVNASGSAEVVVSVNQKAFKQKMAVRDINNKIDGRTSNDIATAVTFGSS